MYMQERKVDLNSQGATEFYSLTWEELVPTTLGTHWQNSLETTPVIRDPGLLSEFSNL